MRAYIYHSSKASTCCCHYLSIIVGTILYYTSLEKQQLLTLSIRWLRTTYIKPHSTVQVIKRTLYDQYEESLVVQVELLSLWLLNSGWSRIIISSIWKYITTRFSLHLNRFKGRSSGFRPSIINYIQRIWIARNFVSFSESLGRCQVIRDYNIYHKCRYILINNIIIKFTSTIIPWTAFL